MSVKALSLRGQLAAVFKRIVFTNGEQDSFEASFSSLTPYQRRQYDELARQFESTQLVLEWYGKAGPQDIKQCPNCNFDCLSIHEFCPKCGTQHTNG